MRDDRKCVNRVWVESETLDWLIMLANKKGMAVADFAGTLLNELASTWQPPDPASEDSGERKRRLYWNWRYFRERKRARERVYQAAAEYATNPDEDGADRLAQLCDDAGLSYDEVISDTRHDPFSSIIASSKNSTKFGSCTQWLSRYMTEHGEAEVGEITAAAATEGYSYQMLKQVKQAICADANTPNIASVRRSTCWAWKIVVQE